MFIVFRVHETHSKMRQDKKTHQVWIRPMEKDCRVLVNGEAITEEVGPPSTGGPAYYVLHPQKGITICLFLTYQAFINREGIIYRKILTEGLQI